MLECHRIFINIFVMLGWRVCQYIHTRQTSFIHSFTFRYTYDVISVNNARFWWLCWWNLFHWTWNKVYHGYSQACFIHWHIPWNWQWWFRTKLYDIINDLNFPTVNFPLYIATFLQHLHMKCVSPSW